MRLVVDKNGKDIKTGLNIDICRHCSEDSEEFWDCTEGVEIDIDDYGVMACQPCFDTHMSAI